MTSSIYSVSSYMKLLQLSTVVDNCMCFMTTACESLLNRTMDHHIPTAFEYNDYLVGKISKHHIIPQNILNQIKNYKCSETPGTLFCMELLQGIDGEFCGNPKPTPDSRDPFLWETGNLFYGPSQTYRTEDSKSGFDDKVVPLLDCIGTDNFGSRLKRAFNSLMTYKQDITKDCNRNSDNGPCIAAVSHLNLFYQGFCGVKFKPLYDLEFYLTNFWRYDREGGGKHKFRLLEGDEINCESINLAASHFPAIVGNDQLQPVFLEGEAVVSNHFHKTKTADASSSFILDDSVDARF